MAKGLVKRSIIRIVTPGTVIESNMLDERAPSYILSLYTQKDRAGVAFADVSTGEFSVYEFKGVKQHLREELSRIAPKEILTNDQSALLFAGQNDGTAVTVLEESDFARSRTTAALSGHFRRSAEELGLGKQKLALAAAGALLGYLSRTQMNALSHITEIRQFVSGNYMLLDNLAQQNLELTESRATRSRKGSLLGVLDRTITSMGSRQLRAWIERPLYDRIAIENRLDAVEAFVKDPITAQTLRELLDKVYDVERLLSKIAYESVNGRDCLALASSLRTVPSVKQTLRNLEEAEIRSLDALLDPVEEIESLLTKAIDEDAPVSVKEGKVLRSGYSDELDHLHSAAVEGKNWIARLEDEEKEKTGIKNLKVGFNHVFGYYIEITKTYYHLVPDRYIRKQTLANCERFVTQELKDLEKTVLGADEAAVRLEYGLFVEIREKLKEALPRLQHTAQGLKSLDALLALADTAQENGYIKPQINEEGRLSITEGRHPVIEKSIGREAFVPNDTNLDDQNRVMVITGPNMAGKSTYMRQVALIVLMAHVGSFVPAEFADIPLTDRIFTRIGASDDLYGGQSTFMVEMNEMAEILRNATTKSLLILDEVGRGTSTFDGLSIAWAAVEYIAQKTKAKTLFATHYHELSELEGTLEGVRNYRITAKECGEEVVFLRKIVPGGADRSFGVAVASLAGLPSSLISRARQIMARLEVNGEISGSIGQHILDKRRNSGDRQVALTDYRPMELIEELQNLDVTALTPMDALNRLFTICEKARRI